MQRPPAVAEVAPQLAEDRGDRERREACAAVGVKAVDGLYERHAGDLGKVLVWLGRVCVATRELAREWHETLDQRFASGVAAAVLRTQGSRGLRPSSARRNGVCLRRWHWAPPICRDSRS